MKETKLKRTLFILDEFHKRSNNTFDAYDEIAQLYDYRNKYE
jgi:hypothetical protein